MFVSRASLLPFRHRDFRLYFVGQATSTLGSAFTAVALVFAVLQVTGSAADVGLALAATRLPVLLFVLAGGVAGDRFPRRTLMLASDAGRFATQAVGAALLLSGTARLWELLVLFSLNGLAQAFFAPASVGLVPELVDDASLQPANALIGLARGGAGLLGMLLGGALVSLVGPGAAFAIDSGSFVVSACALARLGSAGTVALPATGSLLHELGLGWREFVSRTWLWVGVAHVALLNALALVSFFALGPVVAQRSLGGGAAWGVIGAAFAAGMIAGSAIATRWSPQRPLVAAFGVVVFAAPQLALLASSAPLVLVAAAAALGGAQSSVWSSLWTTTMQRDVPADVLARVASYSQVGSLVAAPVGFAVVGFATEGLGLSTVLWFGAAWIVVSTAVVVTLPAVRLHRRTPAPLASPA